MSDPVFDEAKRALERLSSDPAAQELARDREIWAWSYAMDMKLSRQAGARGVLRRQLESKFGALPAAYVERLDQADGDEVLRFAERVLVAKTLEDVFG